MLITIIEELRLAAPAHAYDSIDGLVGFIDNSEHDFLEEKLGTPLYESLCRWYDANPVTRTTVADYQTGYYNRLLLLCQRVVAFDALGRAAGMQIVSVNNAGINQMSADDYKAADDKAVDTYRQTCTKEAHAALNQLLRQLEQWCKEVGAVSSSISDAASGESEAIVPDGSPSGITDELQEIVSLWHHSPYYYLAAALLIPSCTDLQHYLNIYDSREKFIQLLPDLRFIQEEQLSPAIGEPLMLAVIAFARDSLLPSTPAVPDSPTVSAPATVPDGSPSGETVPVATMQHLVHRLRKAMAALLVGRTAVLKYTKEQKIQAHDDGVRMLQNVVEYLRQHQQDFPEALVKDAPWYVATAFPPPSSCSSVPSVGTPTNACTPDPSSSGNAPACWTPPLL